ncbi:MAG: LacI family DNA-binding transcriptional regulator [Bacteroidota bacterium]
MAYEAVTIKDIAKALGFSTSTVSRALRDSYEISQETKTLVLECAEKLNYKPNPAALSLKERKTRSIGLIVCEIANTFFSQVIDGMDAIAYDRGYNLIITQSHESMEREITNLNFLASRSVDGLLISLSTETNDMSHFKALHDKGMPIVFFDRIATDIKTHMVVLDNFKASYDATEHLLQNGYKNIAAICSSEFLSNSKERIAGYEEALRANGIPVNQSMIKHCFYGGIDSQEVDDAVNTLYTAKDRPDAILCTSDKLTACCLGTLIRRGMRIPEDVALVGFSNTQFGELISPPLTVVRQPASEMGKAATELLIQLIESKRPVVDFEKRVLSPEMIIRASSAKVKTKHIP